MQTTSDIAHEVIQKYLNSETRENLVKFLVRKRVINEINDPEKSGALWSQILIEAHNNSLSKTQRDKLYPIFASVFGYSQFKTQPDSLKLPPSPMDKMQDMKILAREVIQKYTDGETRENLIRFLTRKRDRNGLRDSEQSSILWAEIMAAADNPPLSRVQRTELSSIFAKVFGYDLFQNQSQKMDAMYTTLRKLERQIDVICNHVLLQ